MTTVSVSVILTPMGPNEQLNNGAGSVKMRRIEWEASEYVHHDKGALWMIALAVVAVIGVGAAVIFQLWMFAFLIALMAVAFGYYGIRQPKTLHYKLSDEGLVIGDKSYPMSSFKAFGIIEDGAFYTVRLIPAKRLSPAILIYFAEADGEQIVDILGSHIPMEHMEPDLIDVIMQKLHF